MSKKVVVPPKDKQVTIYIRNVSSNAKKKFVEKAKAKGYKPRELFELMVKSI